MLNHLTHGKTLEIELKPQNIELVAAIQEVVYHTFMLSKRIMKGDKRKFTNRMHQDHLFCELKKICCSKLCINEMYKWYIMYNESIWKDEKSIEGSTIQIVLQPNRTLISYILTIDLKENLFNCVKINDFKENFNVFDVRYF